MNRQRQLLSVGALALTLAAGGVSTGLAWDDGDYPVLPSDQKPAPVPPYPLPSDSIPGTAVPFPLKADPVTGKLVPNTPTQTSNSWFLTYPNRLDSTASACQYYLDIKAVKSCGPSGELGDPITFEQWKKAVKIGKHALEVKVNGEEVKEDVAHFVNQVDLNLTRDHHMISYSPNQLAGYVCNHSGPAATAADPTSLFPAAHEIDAAIRDIKQNNHLVACVAMEYSAQVEYTGVPQAGKPFTKFWIFGPQGALLSTVDLDGRGQKGVPQVCTACHGGTFNFKTSFTGGTAQYTHDPAAATPGDLGAHFLPFDIANFAFASKTSGDDREDAIFRMNLNVFNTEKARTTAVLGAGQGSPASDSITQLITGWYTDVTPHNADPKLKRDYTAPAWKPIAPDIYRDVVAHSCRTCHVAMDNEAFEINPPTASLIQSVTCSAHSMPNSKVTFDRFWLSDKAGVPSQPAGTPHQPTLLSALFSPPTCKSP